MSRILVAEDDPDIASLLTHYLQRAGFEADMVASGDFDLSWLEHKVYPLTDINEAISGIAERNGGFSNFIIDPQR